MFKNNSKKSGKAFYLQQFGIQFCKKLWKGVLLTNFAIFFKFCCLLISSKGQQISHFFQHWSTYDNLLGYWKTAVTKLICRFSSGSKNENDTKIFKEKKTKKCEDESRNKRFDFCKILGQNQKSHIFRVIGIPEINVQLFEHFKKLIELQVSCLVFTWVA